MEFSITSQFAHPVEEEINSNSQIVLPGKFIGEEGLFMRGHGTHIENSKMVVTVCGLVSQVGKHISVKPFNSRYTGEIGDVVIGRVTGIDLNQWVVDLNARLHAVLNLGAVSFEDGVPRRRTMHDSFNMRNYFVENDVIVADIRSIFQDGSIALQVSKKQGKLVFGKLITVPHSLIKKSKVSHHMLPCGVEIILANNGNLWVAPPRLHKEFDKDSDSQQSLVATEHSISKDVRQSIARVCNCIDILSQNFLSIDVTSIMSIYTASQSYSLVEMLKPGFFKMNLKKFIM